MTVGCPLPGILEADEIPPKCDPFDPPLHYEIKSTRDQMCRLSHDVALIYGRDSTIVADLRSDDDDVATTALLRLVATAPPQAEDSAVFARMQSSDARRTAVLLLVGQLNLDVVPVLLDWLKVVVAESRGVSPEAADVEVHLLAKELSAISYGIRVLQAKAALPGLRTLMKARHEPIRTIASTTIASLDIPEATESQREITEDSSLNLRLRCQAATSLARRGHQAGREMLMHGYREFLRELDTTRRHSETLGCTSGMETLADEDLITTLEALAEREPAGGKKRNILSHVKLMKINSKPDEELKKMAADNEWLRTRSTRYEAIKELGRRGDLALIPFLENLEPWVVPEAANDAVCGIVDFQQQVMRDEIIAPAINQIRLRSARDSRP